VGQTAGEASVQIEPNATAGALEMARKQIGIVFAPAGKTEKVTAGTTLKSLERILGSPRGGWNGPLLRALWPALHDRLDGRRLSVDLEEARRGKGHEARAKTVAARKEKAPPKRGQGMKSLRRVSLSRSGCGAMRGVRRAAWRQSRRIMKAA
jgi:hypothetical protein